MNIKDYLKDKWVAILVFLFSCFFTFLLQLAFKVNIQLIIAIIIIWTIAGVILLVFDYLRKKYFYQELMENVAQLDKGYLVLELISRPNFYEGDLLYQILYDINKSMIENVKEYEMQVTDFKNYIEMWIHEVKIPLSTLTLMAHNHKGYFDKKTLLQMKRIDDYLEQVLYYARQEFAEHDYLIGEVELSKVIKNIALKNKDDLLENHIGFIVEEDHFTVLSDSKWLEFIINQIVNNSIKYYDSNKPSSYIRFSFQKEKDRVLLIIEDNGIGIPSSDLTRVFEKSFTGHNGRSRAKSTGMGLFIVKSLCTKLGHKIEITSKEKEYTKCIIIFDNNPYYEVIK